MPQGGIVTTYSDITDRVAAATALARANETLERRVRERTAELLDVNAALAVAKTKADEANLDKTRFLAAASHDILQPLNAARLYATSLTERHLPPSEAGLAKNVDASLSAVEEIFGALIEISTTRFRPPRAGDHEFCARRRVRSNEGRVRAIGAIQGVGTPHRGNVDVGPLGSAAAATRAAEPYRQRHQVHPHGQGAC